MINFRTTIVVFFMLCAMGVFGYYFGRTPSLDYSDEEDRLHRPDVFITSFKMIEFNEAGQLSKQLVSEHVSHISYQNQYFLHAPEIQFRVKEETFYTLYANEAKTIQGFEEIHFNGDVFLEKLQSKNEQPFSMYTSSLTYLPKIDQAFTNQPVEFKQAEHLIHANGMQANLKTNQMTLNHAKAQFKPNHV